MITYARKPLPALQVTGIDEFQSAPVDDAVFVDANAI
jgi:hypothetical protein